MSAVRYRTRFVFLLAAAALYGCAGNGEGLGSSSAPLTADFQSIQDNVFTPICSKCHVGAGAPEGLQLDATHSYAALVGTPSTEQPSVLRVATGAPDSSYMIRKLQGTPGITGAQMPFGGPYLPQSTIDVIRQWITNGAPKAAAQSVEAAMRRVQQFAVADTSPDSDAVVSMALPQIIVEFNGEIDSTLINSSTVTLQSATGEHLGDPMLVSTSIPAGNPAALLIRPPTPLADGTYRVTLHGSLANMNAQALGADVSFTFTVDALQ